MDDQALTENTGFTKNADSWSFEKKCFLRLICIYFFLYIFPFPFNAIDYIDENGLVYYNAIWHLIIPWVGENILHLPYSITIFPNGSGDTTYNYVQIFVFFTISVVLALIWTYIDMKKKYDKRYHTGFSFL